MQTNGKANDDITDLKFRCCLWNEIPHTRCLPFSCYFYLFVLALNSRPPEGPVEVEPVQLHASVPENTENSEIPKDTTIMTGQPNNPWRNPPRNKGLRRPYWRKPTINEPLIRHYFWGEGGYIRGVGWPAIFFPWVLQQSDALSYVISTTLVASNLFFFDGAVECDRPSLRSERLPQVKVNACCFYNLYP